MWFASLRVGLLAAGVVMWHFLTAGGQLPADRTRALVLADATTIAGLLLAAWFGRKVARGVVNAVLLFDGPALALAVYDLGGLHGPGVVLVIAHVAGVSLLVSLRTGTKVALWHSLMIAAMLYADAAGLLGHPAIAHQTLAVPDLHGYLTLLAGLWITAIATSTFAAANERELRRRRYDAELLQTFFARLHRMADPQKMAQELAATVGDGLVARRTLVIAPGALRSAGDVEHGVIARWPAETRPATAAAIPPGSVLATAIENGAPVLVQRLNTSLDPWLDSELPSARGVVVVPLPLPLGNDGYGWLVVEFGPWRSRSVERRSLSTTSQAAAHAALAMSRAHLLGRLRIAATTDALTGVANRRTFDTALAGAVIGARESGSPLAVALIDLDHFKSINDTHGHQAGDEVLALAARALAATVRENDTVARYGGEEFVVILRDSTPELAGEIAERLRAAVVESHDGLRVTASIGIAALQANDTPDTLVSNADQALYQAKATGRDCCVLAVPAQRSASDVTSGLAAAAALHQPDIPAAAAVRPA